MMPWPRLNASAGDDQPAAPQHERGARAVGARHASTVNASPATSRIERGGSSHDDLAAELRVEHARRARSGPSGPSRACAAAADAARLVAGEPAEAVVPEQHVPEAVVLRAADVRTARRGPELHDRDPPAAGGERREAEHARRAPMRRPSCGGPASRYTSPNAGSTRNACSSLARKPKPTSAPRRDEPPRAPVLERARHRVRAGDEQQHEQRVGVVEPEHQRGDRASARTPRRRSSAGGGREPALDRRVTGRRRRRRLRAPAARGCSTSSRRRCAPRSP